MDVIALKTKVCMMTGIGGSLFSYVFGWSEALESLLWLMVLDYISGVIAAYIQRELNSNVGYVGILRKMGILCVVGLANFLDYAMGASMVHSIAVWFFIGNEGISVLENAAKAGLPIPDKLHQTLEQLTKKG